MSNLEKMIQKECSNGVEYIEIGSLLDYIQPGKYIVKDTKYDNKYNIPVLTAGQTFILGYTKEEEGVFKANNENPVIIFDDFTTSFHWVNFDFKVKSSAMKMLKVKDNMKEKANFRYIYHCMSNIKYEPKDHARQWISKYSNFKIAIPPLEVQKEIVRILDNLTELTAELKSELTSELTARQKQYEYYRNKLLSFDESAENLDTLHTHTHTHTHGYFYGQEIKWIKLGDIGSVCMCKRIMKNQTKKEGDIPFYKIGTFGKNADAYISKTLFEEYKDKYSYPKKGTILLSASGTIGRTVIYNGEPAYFQDSNIVWIDNDERIILNKYLYYLYRIIDWKVEGGTIKRLYNDNIKNTVIPVPSLEVQEKTVQILDEFDKLTNYISEVLPAEIEARQKQYEYYRNKLLSFKELKTA